MSRFLLEVLCEEIPANALPGIRSQLEAGYRSGLAEAGLGEFEVRTLSTVRRVVVYVEGLPGRQPDRTEEVTGPPVRAAFAPDGTPTRAAEGFARGQGAEVGDLRRVAGPKGEVVAVTKHLPGRPTPEVLAEVTAAVFSGLHFPKAMRWGAGEHAFVRPIHNVLALFGDAALDSVVPLELFGVRSGGSTTGHRVFAPAQVEVLGRFEGLEDYRAWLSGAAVMVDHEERRAWLERRMDAIADELGCAVRPDPELLAELVELVECPQFVRGRIDARFLALPEEVLVTTLRHHQKCLVLEKDGKVAPTFLAVCDRQEEPGEIIVQGYEWVAGARLADAEFFFEHDRRRSLEAHAAGLDRVTFHQKLGSYAAKTGAVAALARELVTLEGDEAVRGDVARAAALAKADLPTSMVGEFPELQGVIGGIYARLDGEAEAVWQAVYDQYRPAGLEGPLPRGRAGAVLGVADRLDTLAGLFAAGEVPSGSKDPFALRRAALAVVRVCAEAPLALDLRAAVQAAVAARGGGDDVAAAVAEFVEERERYYLVSVTGVAGDVADAVLAAGWGVVPGDAARAAALQAVRGEAVFADLAVAFKRVRNMVERGGAGRGDAALLREAAEKELLSAVSTVEEKVEGALGSDDLASALRALAELAQPLDRFFTDVLVLCEDEDLRQARLALLTRVEALFLRLADLSRLAA